jgi:hypothetical protein
MQYGAIGNSLRNKWELEKHTRNIIENHWELDENTLWTHCEQGANTKIQKKSQNQPYTCHPSRPSHWMHEISIPKLFVTKFGLGSYPFLRMWIPNIYFFAIFCQKNPPKKCQLTSAKDYLCQSENVKTLMPLPCSLKHWQMSQKELNPNTYQRCWEHVTHRLVLNSKWSKLKSFEC